MFNTASRRKFLRTTVALPLLGWLAGEGTDMRAMESKS